MERDSILCKDVKGSELCPGRQRAERNPPDHEEQYVDRRMEGQVPGLSGGAPQEEAAAEATGEVQGIGPNRGKPKL